MSCAAPPARPFLKWAGGKSQLLPELLKRLPPRFNRYFEPFLGGGAMFFAVRPTTATLSDANDELVNAWKVVRDSSGDLVAALEAHRYEKTHYYEVRARDRAPDFASSPPAERAARLIYLNRCGFNGLYRVNRRGEFNVPFGRYENPVICDRAGLMACSALMEGVELATADFGFLLDAAGAGDFVYLDPPYLPTSTVPSFTAYTPDGFDAAAQIRLHEVLAQLDRRGVRWLLSNSPSPFILDLYRGFEIEEVVGRRSVGRNAASRRGCVEIVVRNYRG